MTTSIIEIRASDGLYPATFDGINDAIKAYRFDQKQTDKWVTAVFENGDRMHFPVRSNGNNDVAKEAAKIAHFLRIEHNPNCCLEC
ncbi:MAG: hypothetical protein A3C71_01310 [Candidatus Yanofskybacteria bacterium RIFCSPHIGHO2_02_FULL_43_15c]|uniref:Uncharacterized protein n=1 Tax=Candidatus Yanofskybacteria bacterium RIFCSPHIGHO2_02_FULL_43_15c TaxID=1802679 RepID=A0A1F8FIA4_9BACT|nr:MAG: hypothetical protein A3C71_01310 [Candidatus Yanofskybacteria bacterium RIFCSPHIGHO2_02_FULL_43_15c]